jgi:hypothetical protein
MLYLHHTKLLKSFVVSKATQKAPRSWRTLGAFLVFNVTCHGYFALWSLNHWHIMYATMPAITDIIKLLNSLIVSPPFRCKIGESNEVILHHLTFIVNAPMRALLISL